MSVVFRETRLLEKKWLNTLRKKPLILNKNLIVNLLILRLNTNTFLKNRCINNKSYQGSKILWLSRIIMSYNKICLK